MYFLKLAGGGVLMVQIGRSFLKPEHPYDGLKSLVVAWTDGGYGVVG
jgi:hypothetical protein